MLTLFKKPVFLGVTLGHFTIDIFNSSGPVLVTFLSLPMALSAAQIGFAVGAYQFFSALTQPFFGWLDDKIGSRWLGPLSVLWTVGFIVLSLMLGRQTNNFTLFLIPFVLASVGSSAFHPLGTKHAADTSTERAATGTAIFFLFGQAGLATGPILVGVILDQIGIPGIYALALIVIPVSLIMAATLRHTTPLLLAETASLSLDPALAKKAIRWGAISILALLIGLRSWAAIGTVTFLPKLFQDMGWGATGYGFITGAFWMASAITGVIAGNLADRFGRRPVVFVTMLLGSIPLYFLPLTGGWLAFPLAMAGGGLLGASHSILVVIAQDVLPGGKAFASGVTLGYLFGMGAVAAWIIGLMADIWSLGFMIQLGMVFGMIAAALAMLLPSTSGETQPQTEGIPA